MKKVLLNFFNKNNLGDDLFIKIITERYENHFSVVLLEGNKSLESIRNMTVYKNKIFYYLSKVIEKLSGSRNIWLKALSNEHDLLVYIGGSIFIEDNNISRWVKDSDFYRDLSIPYYILGSNFGPYKSPEFISLVSDILGKSKDACFRDKTSYELFKELKSTRYATDIVFSIDLSKYEIKNDKTVIFSIINCDELFDKKTTTKYEQEIINMTRKLVDDGYKVIYMSFCKYEGDKIAIKRITGKLEPDLINSVEIFSYDGNLEETLSEIARCEIVIATRFHAMILGLLFSKKVLPMAYSKKTTDVLNDIEFKGNVVDINEIDKFDGSNFDFNCLQINNVDKQIKIAELQFQELDKVLVKKSHE
jgi:colanic acid/amylovoran biosynthesis protein